MDGRKPSSFSLYIVQRIILFMWVYVAGDFSLRDISLEYHKLSIRTDQPIEQKNELHDHKFILLPLKEATQFH
jgi:hypothetical protein